FRPRHDLLADVVEDAGVAKRRVLREPRPLLGRRLAEDALDRLARLFAFALQFARGVGELANPRRIETAMETIERHDVRFPVLGPHCTFPFAPYRFSARR